MRLYSLHEPGMQAAFLQPEFSEIRAFESFSKKSENFFENTPFFHPPFRIL